MSADNWAICPRCLDRAKVAERERAQEAEDAYGQVPAAEYERLRVEAQTPIDTDALQTFREDYGFYGAEDGTITAVYTGHCRVCDLHVDFRFEKPFYELDPAA